MITLQVTRLSPGNARRRESIARWLSQAASIPIAEARRRYDQASHEQRADWREGQRLAELRWRESA